MSTHINLLETKKLLTKFLNELFSLPQDNLCQAIEWHHNERSYQYRYPADFLEHHKEPYINLAKRCIRKFHEHVENQTPVTELKDFARSICVLYVFGILFDENHIVTLVQEEEDYFHDLIFQEQVKKDCLSFSPTQYGAFHRR